MGSQRAASPAEAAPLSGEGHALAVGSADLHLRGQQLSNALLWESVLEKTVHSGVLDAWVPPDRSEVNFLFLQLPPREPAEEGCCPDLRFLEAPVQ